MFLRQNCIKGNLGHYIGVGPHELSPGLNILPLLRHFYHIRTEKQATYDSVLHSKVFRFDRFSVEHRS